MHVSIHFGVGKNMKANGHSFIQNGVKVMKATLTPTIPRSKWSIFDLFVGDEVNNKIEDDSEHGKM